MKHNTIQVLFFALILSGICSVNLYADDLAVSDCLFDSVENTFPEYFYPRNTLTERLYDNNGIAYYIRSYSNPWQSILATYQGNTYYGFYGAEWILYGSIEQADQELTNGACQRGRTLIQPDGDQDSDPDDQDSGPDAQNSDQSDSDDQKDELLILPTESFRIGTQNSVSDAVTGVISFLQPTPGYAIAQPNQISPSTSPEQAARLFLSSYGSSFGVGDQATEMNVIKTKTASRGRTLVRFQQEYDDIAVIGGEMILQMDAAKNIMSVQSTVLPMENVRSRGIRTTPNIASDVARQSALAKVAEVYEQGADTLTSTTPELLLYNPLLLGFSGTDETKLVWRTEVTSEQVAFFNEFVLVDAQMGEVVLHFNQIDGAKNRTTYNAQNGQNLPGITCRLEGGNSSGDSDCDKAYDYAGDTYNFYKTEHGRDSINNAGMEIISTVHYGRNYQNAFWNSHQMVYGDGFVADDVVAHELTHGVTEYESRLVYLNQSGAINESFSDIWGELIDQNNGKGNDADNVRWKIGEEIPGIGAIRDMRDPTVFQDPDRITSKQYYCGLEDGGGVHTNSGVGNKAAYLMTDGGIFNGYNIRGLGYAKVADLFYEVQTNLLTSAAKYTDLYNALILACNNIGYSADDCQQVQKALDAVEMNVPACRSSPPSPCSYSISPTTASFTQTGGTGNISVTVRSGCNWTATSSSNWITVTSGNNGSGNGVVSYSVSSNSSSSSRTGTVSAAGKTLTVTQTGRVVNTKPTAPSNPSATAISSSSIRITWTDNSNNETGFYVYRWDGSDWVRIATVGANTTSYTDTGLQAGTTYYHVVAAYNNAGESRSSTNSIATTTKVTDTAQPVLKINIAGQLNKVTILGTSGTGDTGTQDVSSMFEDVTFHLQTGKKAVVTLYGQLNELHLSREISSNVTVQDYGQLNDVIYQ